MKPETEREVGDVWYETRHGTTFCCTLRRGKQGKYVDERMVTSPEEQRRAFPPPDDY